ncbi:MAG: hypothetical protein R3F17_12955 [Planctomycetota bacterium]
MVGQSDVATGQPVHGMWADATGMHDMGLIMDYTKAHGINDAGMAVGEALVGAFGDLWAVPFRYDTTVAGATPTQLTGTYASGSARAINALGHITGWVSGNEDFWGDAFLHDGINLYDLGSPIGKSYSIGTALNNNDVAVGYAFGEWVYLPCCGSVWSNAIHTAVVTRNMHMVRLNDLIDAAEGWNLQQAVGINDRGRIIGYGAHNGTSRGCLLVPIPVVKQVTRRGAATDQQL